MIRLMVAGVILGVAAFTVGMMIYIGNKRRDKSIDKLLQDDMVANFARSRDLEPEYFYTPDLSVLPIRDDAQNDILKKQSQLVGTSNLRMVRFPQKMGNIELKSKYGPANLEKIAGYEENYTRYISALLGWAEALLDHGGRQEKADAIAILENTVLLGSDYRKTYKLLADHYAGIANADGLNHLLDSVASAFEDEGIKRQLTQYIMDKKENL